MDIKNLIHYHVANSIDVVVSVETFEHVENIENVITGVKTILRPGGLWCFTTPNGERYPDHRVVKYHVKHYNKQEITELLEGFTIHIREVGYEHDSSEIFKKPTFGNYSVFALKD